MKPDTVHKAQLLDTEKKFGPRIEHMGFFELDIFSQTELLIGEWP